jgi:hypothetical protein
MAELPPWRVGDTKLYLLGFYLCYFNLLHFFWCFGIAGIHLVGVSRLQAHRLFISELTQPLNQRYFDVNKVHDCNESVFQSTVSQVEKIVTIPLPAFFLNFFLAFCDNKLLL